MWDSADSCCLSGYADATACTTRVRGPSRELRLRVRLLPRTLEPTLHRTPYVCSGHKQATPVALAPLPQEYASVVAYSSALFHAFDKKAEKV